MTPTGTMAPPDLHPFLRAVARDLEGPDRAVIVTDVEGRILSWSAAAEALYQWTAAEVLGADVMSVTPAEMSVAEGEAIMRRLQSGIPWMGTFIIRNRSGGRLLVEVLDLPIRGELGELVGIVGVSRRAGYLPT